MATYRAASPTRAIACYLEDTYGDKPNLFGGESGRAGARFINAWVDRAVHPKMIRIVLSDIYDKAIEAVDQPYFCASREKRFGMALEEFCDNSDARIETFRAALEPARLALE